MLHGRVTTDAVHTLLLFFFFFFNTSPPPPKYILLYFTWAGRKGPFSFLVGSDLETNELVNIRDRGVRACLHAWVGRRAAPSLEMSWAFHRSDASRAPSHGDSLLLLAISVLPHGVFAIGGRKRRGTKIRKMLKDGLEV